MSEGSLIERAARMIESHGCLHQLGLSGEPRPGCEGCKMKFALRKLAVRLRAAVPPDAGLVGLLEAAATMLNQEAAGNCPDHPVSIADLLNMAMRLTKEARRLTERAGVPCGECGRWRPEPQGRE